MPFDKLPGRIGQVPQLLHFYVPPPRPVIPWAQYITSSVDKLAQAVDPVNRAQRQASLAELSLTPQKIALERAQLGAMSHYYQGGFGGGANPMDPNPRSYWTPQGMKVETPQQAMSRANAAVKYQGNTQEATLHNSILEKANQFRNQSNPQYQMKAPPSLQTPHDLQMQLTPQDLSTLQLQSPNPLASANLYDEEDEQNA